MISPLSFLTPEELALIKLCWEIFDSGPDRTTIEAAKKLGRRYIGFELEQKYIEMAQRRLTQEYLFT